MGKKNGYDSKNSKEDRLKPWVAFLGLLTAIVVLVGTLLKVIPDLTPKGSSTLSPLTYIVNVQDKNTGAPIVRAQVIVDVIGESPLTDVTDNLGNASFLIDTKKMGQPIRLTVRKDGYRDYVINANAVSRLPVQVLLDLREIADRSITPASTQALIAPPTFTLFPSKGAYEYNENCDDVPAPYYPCQYTVRDGDGYFKIAEKFYNNRIFTSLLLEYNRIPNNGNYQEFLQRGMKIFIPEKDSPPKLAFPSCVQPANPPCQYKALGNDTYEIIAQDFYKNTSMADMIRNANKEYDPLSDTLVYKKIREGTIVIMPKIP